MSPRQQATVLETIAGRMSALNRLLMLAQATTDEFDKATLIDAAQSMAASVGAMADDAIGGSVCGDTNHWLYGPSFSVDVSGHGKATQGGAA